MEKEIIEKLKELKQLTDDGILTQDEFDVEKKRLLSRTPETVKDNAVEEVEEVVKPNTPYRRNRFIEEEQPTNVQRPHRSIHIPLLYRSVVMKASSPSELINICDKHINRCTIGIGIGLILLIIFIYYCFTGGFWAILNAFVFALLPAIVLFFSCMIPKSRYKELREKFVGMTQKEFDYVQNAIQAERNNAKEAVINFTGDFFEGVNQYAESYQQQTGNNFYYDLGAAIGSM